MQAERPIKIGFLSQGGSSWIAGSHYLLNLIGAIKSTSRGASVKIALVVSETQQEIDEQLIETCDEVIRFKNDPLFDWVQLQLMRIQNKIRKPLELEPPVGKLLHSHEVDCVFGIGEFGPRFSIPLVGWLYDFQHLDLPQNFTQQEIQDRETLFVRVARHATRVVVSSRHAQSAYERTFPSLTSKVRVLPFVAQIPQELYDTDLAAVYKQYNLPEKFIHLPNQFWKHKNHSCAVAALALAAKQIPDATIISTGASATTGASSSYAEIVEQIRSCGLEKNFRMLGLLPRLHALAIMRSSLAVLQPSRYEGWNTSVEEAKSLGKPIILSQIPVHEEQNAENATYFALDDPEKLAEVIVSTFRHSRPGPDLEAEAKAIERRAERTIKFGSTFLEIALEAMGR